jgi:hypothetical protein
VVATWDKIFVSILMDLIGRLRGRVIGRGGRGQRSQGPGTITPWAAAVAAIENNTEIDRSSIRSFKAFIISSQTIRKVNLGAATTRGWWLIERLTGRPLAMFLKVWEIGQIFSNLAVGSWL